MEVSVWVFCLGFPWEPKAESGQDHSAPVRDCFLGEVSGQPRAVVPCGLPGPLLRGKSIQYSMAVGSRHCRVRPEAVGHWQWGSMALIQHSSLQSGLLGETVSALSLLKIVPLPFPPLPPKVNNSVALITLQSHVATTPS